MMKKMLACLLTVALCGMLGSCGTESRTKIPEDTEAEKNPAGNPEDFDCMVLPQEASETLEGRGIEAKEYLKLAANGHNDGMDCLSTVLSPYYTLRVNGHDVPVYATLAYASDKGVLHSFATVYIKNADTTELRVELENIAEDFSVTGCRVLPMHAGFSTQLEGEHITSSLQGVGSYTFLMNETDQTHAFTLTVRENCDDAAEIAALEKTYGEKLVVFEAGYHAVDEITLPEGGAVYFCKDSLVVANPVVEPETNADAFLQAQGQEDILISGYGVLELSLLGHSARNTLTLMNCKNAVVRDITLVNNAAWNLYLYNCEDCLVEGVQILAHRTNSDGINICNSRHVVVRDCFVRCGDDCYSAKTLGGEDTAMAQDILFHDCTAWAGKARCYGITGEAEKNISGVYFSHCDVVAHDATWDNSRIGALAIIIESNPSNSLRMENVIFDNIEIYMAVGRPMNVTVLNSELDHLLLSDILFSNITVARADLLSRVWGENSTNVLSVSFRKILLEGEKMTSEQLEYDLGPEITVE